MKIIYLTKKNTVAVMAVNPALLQTMTLQEAAKKCVPAGQPFKIVDPNDLPDFDFQEAWVIDFSVNDGVGGTA